MLHDQTHENYRISSFNKKRVLFAVDAIEKSGIINAVNNIASELTKNIDYEISIICTEIIDEKKVNPNIRVYDLSINKYGRGKYLLLIPALRHFLRNNTFDYIVVSGMEFVFFYYLATLKTRSKMIAWEHRNYNAGPKFRLEWFGRKIACSSFYKIVCLTKRDLLIYQEHCDSKDKTEQIYNLVKREKKKTKYNGRSKKILSVGFLDEQIKGKDLLHQVAEIVFKSYPEWTWDIYGEGKDKEAIQNNINKKQLQNNIFLKGHSNKMDKLYSDYSMFVFTSRTEGLGMVLVEAQLNRLPVVSFDIECGPSDVISHGINGYLVKPFKINEMAEKIKILINDQKIRNEFSKNSMNNLSEFEESYILKKWHKILEYE